MKSLRSIGLVCLLMCLLLFSFSRPVLADSWHYDFTTGEDLTALTVVNPTGSPTYSIVDPPGTFRLNIPGNAQYDLCTWVNTNAPRFYRAGGNEAFTLETKFSQTSNTHTFIAGLFLYDSGDLYNSLVYGANYSQLKIDRGNGTSSGGGTAPWTTIGNYDDLYLQVTYDGSSSYAFNYKTSAADPWVNYSNLTGFSFDSVGMITKTWYTSPVPAVTIDYDYLYYNYTPAPVPVPPTMLLLGSGLIGLLGVRKKWATKGRRS